MTLQELTIQKITDTVGFVRVTSVLSKMLKTSKPEDRFYLENLMIYFNVMQEINIDIESDCLQFPEQSRHLMNILNAKCNNFNQDVVDVLIGVISNNLKQVEKIRLFN